jgi:formamidopyrimidine-DNA glycosylase
MPELPEVETVRRGIELRALGRTIAAVEVRHHGAIAGDAEDFRKHLERRVISTAERKGKAIAVELASSAGQSPCYLIIRLGMTGQVTLNPSDAPHETHTHVLLKLDDGKEELCFRDPRRFGRLRCCTREEKEAIFSKLGPDAQKMTEDEFLGAARGRTGAIKSWLMNQALFAGLGNIYADEALFVARIHPLAQPGRVSEGKLKALLKAVRRVLDHAVNLQGTTFSDYIDIEGRPGNFASRLRVYQRDGEPCRRCKITIRRIVIAGRSSHFCPQCQPRPRKAAKRDKRRKQ